MRQKKASRTDREQSGNIHVYIYLLPVAMVLLGLLCRINKLLHCGQGAGICIGCEYQVLIG